METIHLNSCDGIGITPDGYFRINKETTYNPKYYTLIPSNETQKAVINRLQPQTKPKQSLTTDLDTELKALTLIDLLKKKIKTLNNNKDRLDNYTRYKDTDNIILTKRRLEKAKSLVIKYLNILKQDVNLVSALKKLKPHKVIIPFAEELVNCMSDDLLSRTYFKRFLDYIKASALLHQYQRCFTHDNSLVATWTDYVLARIAFLKTVSNEAMVSLNRDQQRLLGLLKREGRPMNVSEIHQELAKPKTWIYRNLEYLKEYNLIKERLQPHPTTQRETAYYEIFLLCSYGIPTAPTDKVSNIPIFPMIMKEVDEKRLKEGLQPMYERYYSLISWNSRNVGISNQSTGEDTKNTNRNISGISQEYLIDDVIKIYGGKKESKFITS